MNDKVMKIATTFGAINSGGDTVFTCDVWAPNQDEPEWALTDGDNGAVISRHSSETEAIEAAKAECAQYILPWPQGTK